MAKLSNLREAWIAEVKQRAATGDDRWLIEQAASPDFAGNQSALGRLCGMPKESISRAKAGRSFDEGTRQWFEAYLTTAKPPPPIPRGEGRKPKPGTGAPKIWCEPELHAAFVRRAADLDHDALGQTALFVECIRKYLTKHRSLRPVPDGAPPEGDASIRARVPQDVLEKLDSRIGGAVYRAAHIRAALAEELADELAKPATKKASKPAARKPSRSKRSAITA